MSKHEIAGNSLSHVVDDGVRDKSNVIYAWKSCDVVLHDIIFAKCPCTRYVSNAEYRVAVKIS